MENGVVGSGLTILHVAILPKKMSLSRIFFNRPKVITVSLKDPNNVESLAHTALFWQHCSVVALVGNSACLHFGKQALIGAGNSLSSPRIVTKNANLLGDQSRISGGAVRFWMLTGWFEADINILTVDLATMRAW